MGERGPVGGSGTTAAPAHGHRGTGAVPWSPAVECATCACGEAHIVIPPSVPTVVGRAEGDAGCGRVEVVYIPAHVQAIGAQAFSQAKNLVAVNMAQHGVLRRFEEYAFQGCSRVASVAS